MHRLLLPLLLLVTPGASAAEPVFRVGADGFGLPLDVPGAEVCIIKPAALRDPGRCEGLAVAAVEAQLPRETAALAVLRYPEFGALLTVVRATEAPRGGLDDAQVRLFLEGARKGLAGQFGEVEVRGLTPGAEFDTLPAGGRQVYRFLQVLPEGANDGLDRVLSYAAVSGTGLYTVMFGVEARQLEDVRPSADALVRRLELGPTPEAGPPPEGRMETALGVLVGWFAALAVTLGGVLVWLRRRARSAAGGAGAAAAGEEQRGRNQAGGSASSGGESSWPGGQDCR